MLWADIFTAYDCHGAPYWFLNVLCDGTGFGVCYCVGQARGVPSASRILHFFTLVWTSWAGWPHAITVDRGKEFMGEDPDEAE